MCVVIVNVYEHQLSLINSLLIFLSTNAKPGICVVCTMGAEGSALWIYPGMGYSELQNAENVDLDAVAASVDPALSVNIII